VQDNQLIHVVYTSHTPEEVSELKTYHKNLYFKVHTQTRQQLRTKEEYKALQFAVLTILICCVN